MTNLKSDKYQQQQPLHDEAHSMNLQIPQLTPPPHFFKKNLPAPLRSPRRHQPRLRRYGYCPHRAVPEEESPRSDPDGVRLARRGGGE